MVNKKDNKNEDEWELHPLFLSKIPSKGDIDKNSALSALITIINEEEEKETFNYEPRRKNLKKKITEKGEVIHTKDRRNFFEPYKSKEINNLGIQKLNKNIYFNKYENVNEGVNNVENSDNASNKKKNEEETSLGELLVCLSMVNLK
ncbi:conserved Plasmodium protein, unknown function [Plasmodium gallinaceum]|uniref:Uncharacterized protein n=1 Tax=Plasmodium gallinaceum TaxID=5849 RepID=A0A1J1H0A1_PLAGA|nr:conserved Plasmodium protein, unknown function [Plasmodium gallinaceum]CRG96708.1 conserved Plasmodium protein, unknown function [Plasmodium gallinaceum]